MSSTLGSTRPERANQANWLAFVTISGARAKFNLDSDTTSQPMFYRPPRDRSAPPGDHGEEVLFRIQGGRHVLIFVSPEWLEDGEEEAGPINRELTPDQASRWLAGSGYADSNSVVELDPPATPGELTRLDRDWRPQEQSESGPKPGRKGKGEGQKPKKPRRAKKREKVIRYLVQIVGQYIELLQSGEPTAPLELPTGKEIAKRTCVDPSTVSRAVGQLLKEYGAENKSGLPRGRKEKDGLLEAWFRGNKSVDEDD